MRRFPENPGFTAVKCNDLNIGKNLQVANVMNLIPIRTSSELSGELNDFRQVRKQTIPIQMSDTKSNRSVSFGKYVLHTQT